MKKLTEFIKKNYIVFIIISTILLVVIFAITLLALIKNVKNKINYDQNKESLYEIVNSNKEEFNATIHRENDKIASIESKDFNIYNKSAIYYLEKFALIIPKKSSIVYYYRDNLAYKIDKYSELTLENNAKVIKNNGVDIVTDNFFIYDGEDLYIFPRDVVLKINNDSIELGAGSFVYADYKDIIYYDKLTDAVKKIKNVNNAGIMIDSLGIDRLNDATVYNNQVKLLNKDISHLDDLKPEINEEENRKEG